MGIAGYVNIVLINWAFKKLFQKGNTTVRYFLALFHKALLAEKGSENTPENDPKCIDCITSQLLWSLFIKWVQ